MESGKVRLASIPAASDDPGASKKGWRIDLESITLRAITIVDALPFIAFALAWRR
jgi:hypothetical protein